MMVSDDITKILGNLDNMFIVFILHGISKEYSSIKDQVLTNTTIHTVEELIDHLAQVSLLSDNTHTDPDSSAFVSNFINRGSDGCGHGQERGRGGRSKFYCTHYRKNGHTQDRCFYLHGYPNKTVNVSQTIVNCESKGELKTTFSVDEYQEYLRLKATQQATSSATIARIGNSMVCLSHATPIG